MWVINLSALKAQEITDILEVICCMFISVCERRIACAKEIGF